MAVRVTGRAVQISGAAGLEEGSPVERWYRDAPKNVIGGFASNRLRELVAEGMGVPHLPYEPMSLDGTGLERAAGALVRQAPQHAEVMVP